jgi:signal transduction histidine kinase
MASTAAAQNQGVLQDLLHVLSQPLTTLHCALEHSLEADDAPQTDDVALALEQTDRVIEAVCLMREYLEAEEGCFLAEPFPLGLAIENVLEELSVLAEARGLLLFASGTSRAAIPVRNAWLQRALLYLFALLLESEPSGRAIVVLLEDGVTESVISGHGLPGTASFDNAGLGARRSNTLQQVRIAIAQRVLTASGGSVEFYSDAKSGFAIRIPKPQIGSAIDQLTA